MNPMAHYAQAESVFRNEIAALEHALQAIRGDFDRAVEMLLSLRGKAVITGVGKSGIVAHKIAATLASTGTPAVFLNAGEALHGDLGLVGGGDIVVMVSNSAQTTELCRLLPSIQKIGAQLIGILGSRTAALSRACECVLDAGIVEEACPLRLAPMTSTTVALVIGDALAAALMKARGFSREQFAVYHPGGALGRRLLLRVQDVMFMGEHVPRISPDKSLKEAILEMDRCNLGAVIAAHDSDQVAGILSEGDLRRLILRGTSLEVSLSGIMTRNPLVIQAKATLGEALDLMEGSKRKVYVLPVVDEAGLLRGILRMHDVVAG